MIMAQNIKKWVESFFLIIAANGAQRGIVINTRTSDYMSARRRIQVLSRSLCTTAVASNSTVQSPLSFDNSFVREMPADPIQGSELRDIENALFSFCDPSPCTAPALIISSDDMCETLG